jgi:hypothetical protein
METLSLPTRRRTSSVRGRAARYRQSRSHADEFAITLRDRVARMTASNTGAVILVAAVTAPMFLVGRSGQWVIGAARH